MKCKVCNKRFRLLKENKYTITVHFIELNCLTKTYEAFDCPKCGCQNIVNKRELPNTSIKESEEYES